MDPELERALQHLERYQEWGLMQQPGATWTEKLIAMYEANGFLPEVLEALGAETLPQGMGSGPPPEEGVSEKED